MASVRVKKDQELFSQALRVCWRFFLPPACGRPPPAGEFAGPGVFGFFHGHNALALCHFRPVPPLRVVGRRPGEEKAWRVKKDLGIFSLHRISVIFTPSQNGKRNAFGTLPTCFKFFACTTLHKRTNIPTFVSPLKKVFSQPVRWVSG